MENVMGNKFHRNPMQMPSTTEEKFDDAFAELKQRELLYNRDKKELGIKIGDRLIIPKPRVDEYNVTYNEDDEIALKDDITVDSVTAQADRQGVDWKSQTVLQQKIEQLFLYALRITIKRQEWLAFSVVKLLNLEKMLKVIIRYL